MSKLTKTEYPKHFKRLDLDVHNRKIEIDVVLDFIIEAKKVKCTHLSMTGSMDWYNDLTDVEITPLIITTESDEEYQKRIADQITKDLEDTKLRVKNQKLKDEREYKRLKKKLGK